MSTSSSKKKVGRPPGSVDPDSRSQRVGYTNLRVDKDTRDKLNLIAEDRKTTVAAYLREHARKVFAHIK